MATELEALGFALTDSSGLWSAAIVLSHPEAVRRVHDAYLAHGADIIETCTYQATLANLRAAGIADPAADFFRPAIALACSARDARGPRSALVAISLGCYGAALCDGSEFTGNYNSTTSDDDLRDFHGARLAACLRERQGADFVLFETFPLLREAVVLCRHIAQTHADVFTATSSHPEAFGFVVSFSCHRPADKLTPTTCGGDAFAACIEALLPFRATGLRAVGINCTAPSLVSELLASVPDRLRRALPVFVYPNSGEHWDGIQRKWSGHDDPADWAALAAAWRRDGTDVIGGCCRTTPRHTAAVKAQLSSRDN